MATLAEIRAKLAENAKKGGDNSNRGNSGGDNASYPFWNIPFDGSSTVRFLPDADDDNILFWRKREIIKLPFQGVVGGEYPTDKDVTVQVPCIDMFDMACPIIAHTRPWWKEDDKKDLARTYYKKRSYIFQGFVVNDGIPEAEGDKPENPIRRFVINQSLFEIIERSLLDPDMEDSPTHYDNGCDFKINKTKKGEYANYQSSQWARRSRALTEDERGAIEQHKLFDLKTFLGRVPDGDEIEAIKAMFHDSLAGRPFDAASFGKYYRAFGGGQGNGNSAAPATTAAVPTPAAAAPVREEAAPAPAPAAAAPAQSSAQEASADIMARIRARQQQQD